ncbi:MAG: hypothetical protein IT416_03860 [Candidatus Pacebacteria bacterium]|nr:hypothetical protein [Candidatus Paceibacterota bacterium]
MNPTASIVAYLLMVVLTMLSVLQAIRNNLRVLPGNGDIIVMGFTFGISFFFPGYWLWGVIVGALLTTSLSVGINKGWWRVVLLVPLIAVFLIYGGLTLPTYWWR